MSEKLGQEEYAIVLRHVYLAARFLADVNIPAALEAISRADSVGAILDPTLYRAKSAAMQEDAEVLRAALPLSKIGSKLVEASEAKP